VIERLTLDPDHVHVVPLVGIGSDDGRGDVPEEAHTVLFFGRIWAYKGLEYLIRAEPLITAVVPDVKIVIAGKGEDLAGYRRLMVHPERFVVRNYFIPTAETDTLFRQASIVVLPYVEASQSGVVPLAYTYGKPVVVTNVGSLTDIVVDGVTGYVVPPRQVEPLAQALTCLLQDTSLRRQFGANGKLKIRTECSPRAVAQRTYAVYRLAINGQPASP
jgi:glycosyltransferase involved in cell wall biosynthesis